MKKIFLLFALIAFVGTTTVTPVLAADNAIVSCEKCGGDKDKKCNKKCSSKDKKACAKGEKKGCCAAKAEGKSCAGKTDAEKAKCHSKAEGKTETEGVKSDAVEVK